VGGNLRKKLSRSDLNNPCWFFRLRTGVFWIYLEKFEPEFLVNPGLTHHPTNHRMETTDPTNKINKDLILRENLALQRTILANQTTFLSFLRTSMYFLVAGLSIKNLLEVEGGLIYQVLFYVISATIFILGVFNYLRQNKKINESRVHVGNFKTEYEKSS
jgi:putative membrane protein